MRPMSTAYYYCTGPVSCYIRIPTVGAGPYVGPNTLRRDPAKPTFLGHCDKTPKATYEPKYKPVFSSQSGEVIPADKLYMGQEVKIVLPLQRFDHDVVRALKATPRYGRTSLPGTETYLDVGSLLQRNGLGIELWLRNEFYNTVNSAAYPNLPIGTYFLCCNLAGIFPDNMARDAEMCQLLFEANWVEAWPAGSRVCYSEDPSLFTSLPSIG